MEYDSRQVAWQRGLAVLAGKLRVKRFAEVIQFMGKASTTVIVILSVVCVIHAAEYHVSPGGFDSNPGSESQPFRTINAAAQIAEPGDVITVHEGIYRERVNPRRGGSSWRFRSSCRHCSRRR